MATNPVTVSLEPRGTPGMERALAVLQERVRQRGGTPVVEAEAQPQLILSTDSRLPAEAFRLEQAGPALRLAGGSPRGVLYGIGKLLRTSRYEDGWTLSPWRGTSIPQGALRGMYFANHFHNWYQVASDGEIQRYIEDLALWGVNTIMTIYPLINLQGWDDPEAAPAMVQLRRIFAAAKQVGLDTCLGLGNVLFNGTPAELRATPLADPLGRHGNSGTTVCPSLPAGRELILATTTALLRRVADLGLDSICIWPYDEGGCACEHCRPWGANGFLRLSRDLAATGHALFPNLKVVLSTWTFDTPPEGEWQALTEALARDRSWADFILADAHEDYPRYPLDVGVPGGMPLVSFPEISMWGNWPWGGVGAHPLPARLQRLWDQVRQVVRGGFPYSEGIYEDINKAIVSQFYWDPALAAAATLREYCDYEFAPQATDDILAVIANLELNASQQYTRAPTDAARAREAGDLADAVAARLPAWARQGWRWLILHLRAILDRERFAGGGLQTATAQAALERLCEIYHCQIETDDPYHHRVRPPLQRAVSRKGQG